MASDDGQRTVLWRGAKSPTRILSRHFRLPADVVRTVIHNIKDREGLGGSDSLVFYDNGDVEDMAGNWLGNICDEPGVHCGP